MAFPVYGYNQPEGDMVEVSLRPPHLQTLIGRILHFVDFRFASDVLKPCPSLRLQVFDGLRR